MLQKDDLTYRINGCAMTVHRKMGMGFMEYIYCRALAIELRRAGIAFEREVWLPIHYDQYKIGARRVDFLCENNVTVELKAKRDIGSEDFTQALNTLERLNIKSGLLINFGAASLQYHHLFNKKYQPDAVFEEATPEMVGEADEWAFAARHYLPDWEVQRIQKAKAEGRYKA
jgi:GxxExxY protein